LWWTVAIGSPLAVAHNIIDSPYAIKFGFYIVFQALGVYFNLYFLIPRLLEKGRYTQYIISVLLTILATALLIVPGYYVSAALAGKTLQEMYRVDPSNFFYFFKQNTLASSAAAMTLGMSVKLTKNWLQSRNRERELEKEKLETELKFLRSQFHPHFLFNTINSIFVLIRKNPDKASDALEKFSSLLRYQLYECNEKKIPLRQELLYVQNYFELQKLRQDDNIKLRLEIPRTLSDNVMIAPFILVPFIENAFKHVSREYDMNNFISLDISSENEFLVMNVRNSAVDNEHSGTREYSGIGLENIQRRLALLYPDKHDLKIAFSNDEFTVKLQLELEPLSSPPERLSESPLQPVNAVYQ
jgi:two-component system LytT family sensor kinase